MRPRPNKARQFSRQVPRQVGGAPAGIGHNQGPVIARASSWSSFCWQTAHKKAWKTPPLEIVRLRCKRAAGLGLTYRQYTAALLDRGVHPQAIFFDLGGTLLQMKNEKVYTDENGHIRPLPGVLEKLPRLTACKVFVITNDPQAHSFIEQLMRLSGVGITDYGIYGDAAGARRAIADLLGKFNLPAAAAIMVGANNDSRNNAQDAKLAKFIQASEYFAIC